MDAGKVVFKDNVFIDPSCGFYTSGHPLDVERRNAWIEYAWPITAGSNTWFGTAAHGMPSVTIGDNVVFGSGSIVVNDLPSNRVAVGNPCGVIRELSNADRAYTWDN